MPLIIPDGYGQATFHFSLIGSPKSMSWSVGYAYSGAADAPGNASQLYDDSVVGGAPYAPSNYLTSYTYDQVTTIVNDGGIFYLGAAGGSVAGSHVGAAAAPNVALLFKKVTGIGGRKNQGRFFTPPLHFGEDQIDALGTIDGSNVTAVNSTYIQYHTAMETANLMPVVLHSDSTAPTGIASFTLQTTVATQRRRLR